ncbi:hypothetical protein [Amycolatopsis circi]|uniref:hypothetical protein n=1 Tax=Amycolatopsis circi TaxID=871959 RepID=UPI000E23760B|nr:hypothetical protein [Amycolatopsis circi]
MVPVLPAAGDVVYIPVGTPYAIVNLSLNATVLSLMITTDPAFDSDVVPLPELAELAATRANALRTEHLRRIRAAPASRLRTRRQ